MHSAAFYGVVVGLAITVAGSFGPTGALLLWVVVFCQMSVGAVLVWKRTRLPLMTAGCVAGAGASAVFALLAAVNGDGWNDILFQHPLLVVGGAFCPALLMFSERWAHPDAWRRLREQSERSTVQDILLFRHIPDLRPEPGQQ
jgi:hypothetical protein